MASSLTTGATALRAPALAVLGMLFALPVAGQQTFRDHRRVSPEEFAEAYAESADQGMVTRLLSVCPTGDEWTSRALALMAPMMLSPGRVRASSFTFSRALRECPDPRLHGWLQDAFDSALNPEDLWAMAKAVGEEVGYARAIELLWPSALAKGLDSPESAEVFAGLSAGLVTRRADQAALFKRLFDAGLGFDGSLYRVIGGALASSNGSVVALQLLETIDESPTDPRITGLLRRVDGWLSLSGDADPKRRLSNQERADILRLTASIAGKVGTESRLGQRAATVAQKARVRFGGGV